MIPVKIKAGMGEMVGKGDLILTAEGFEVGRIAYIGKNTVRIRGSHGARIVMSHYELTHFFKMPRKPKRRR